MFDPKSIPEPALKTVGCASPRGLHRIAYTEWPCRSGSTAGEGTVVCVHGLTRNGRDFDALAWRLSSRYRVVCPDMVGRGRSERLADPSGYMVAQYLADCVTLIARLDVEQVIWVGTSMGGLIGMSMASLTGNAISKLVVNDIGPFIDPEGLARIARDVGDDPLFDSFEAGEAVLRERMRSFGPHTDAQFRLLSRHYLVERGSRWGFHYDPAIAVPFRALAGMKQPDLWPMWEAIRCPVLAMRGRDSDVLQADVAERMTRSGPRAQLVEFAGVGHAPTLIADDQVEAIENFLNGN